MKNNKVFLYFPVPWRFILKILMVINERLWDLILGDVNVIFLGKKRLRDGVVREGREVSGKEMGQGGGGEGEREGKVFATKQNQKKKKYRA